MPDPSTSSGSPRGESRGDWRSEIRRRLAPLALSPTREIDIVEEIGQHLDDRYVRSRSLGVSEEEAVAIAWRELDDSDVLGRAIARVESPAPLNLPPPGAMQSGSWPGSVWQDIRYSARTLRRSPVFSLAVLLAVALSIGPVTAILSVGNWLLWRPHPGVTDSRSLAIVWFMEWRGNGGSPASMSYENLADIRARGRTFSGIAGVQEGDASLSAPGSMPAQISRETVTANFFDVLGVGLRAGRSFTRDEDRGPFGSPVVVISHGLAVSAFGSPEAALARWKWWCRDCSLRSDTTNRRCTTTRVHAQGRLGVPIPNPEGGSGSSTTR